MKKLAVGLVAGSVVLGLLVPLAFAARFRILVHGMGLFVGAPELVEVSDLGPTARWFDDYYTIEAIDERTFAIGEPRYWQKNFNFLIVGDDPPGVDLVIPGARAEVRVTARKPA